VVTIGIAAGKKRSAADVLIDTDGLAHLVV
jgi:hypothetical protein